MFVPREQPPIIRSADHSREPTDEPCADAAGFRGGVWPCEFGAARHRSKYAHWSATGPQKVRRWGPFFCEVCGSRVLAVG